MRTVVVFAVFAVLLAPGGQVSASPNGNNGNGRLLRSPIIEVWKTRHEMVLRDGGYVLRRFQVALGAGARAPKQMHGDLRTPVGRYYVTEKRPSRRFHRFVGISYPNIVDAERGYRNRLIDAWQWGDIFLANLRRETPTWRTPLGGLVGIHGYGRRPPIRVDWTEGCIAVGNEEIEYIYERVPVGAPVVIHE